MTRTDPRDFRGRHVAVTGATGFIGSHIVSGLVTSGAEVTAVAPAIGWRDTVPELADAGKVRLIVSPRLDDPQDQLAGTDSIVHLAYTPPPPGSRFSRSIFEIQHNLVSTLRLVDALPDSVGHLCFASTASVYGTRPPVPVTESFSTFDVSEYALAKRATEQLLLGAAADRDIRITTLRYSTVYGRMETAPRAVPNFIRRMLAGRSPIVRGTGDDVHDYVHVADVTEATLLALGHSEPGHAVYNVATGLGETTRSLAERIRTLIGADVDIEYTPTPSPPAHIVCDVGLARTALGYRPAVPLNDGLADEIAWFVSRPDLW